MKTLIAMLSVVFLTVLAGCSRDETVEPTADEGAKSVAEEPISEHLSPEMRAQVESYRAMQQAFKASPFVFQRGTIQGAGDLNSGQQQEMAVIQTAYDQIKDEVSLAEGSKIITQKTGDQTAVVFGNRLPPGSKGGDFAARVLLSAEGKVIQIERGG